MASLWVCQTVWRNDASWVRNLLLSVSSFSHCNSTRTGPSMPLFIFQFVTLCTIPLIDISFQTHLSFLNIPSLFCLGIVFFFLTEKKTNQQTTELFKPLCVFLGFCWTIKALVAQTLLGCWSNTYRLLGRMGILSVWLPLTWNMGFPKQKPWDFF